MNDSQIGILRALSIGLLLEATLACAGSDAPKPTPDEAQALAQGYGRGTPPVGNAGSAGAAGDDNSGGSSGASASNGGDGGNPPAGGDGGSSVTEAGSGGEGTAGTQGKSGSGGTSDCDGLALLQASCGLSGCHVAATGYLSAFADADANPDEFVGTEALVGCAGEIVFVPASPADSIVLQKARGTQSCGGPMPPPGTEAPELSEADLTCIEDWIGTL